MSAAKTFVFAALAACFNPTLICLPMDMDILKNVKAYNLAYLCTQSTAGPGCPKPEYCPHCLNTNLGVCGKFGSNSYETSTWVDTKSNPMPFTPEETYLEGDIIMVKSYLDTHHNGHMELKACNKGPANCKQEDFDAPGNELIFIEDMVFQGNHVKMPADPNYPGRGMYGGGQGGQTKTFVFKYKLPEGLYGDQVLLQWRYITANSCSPPGYENYFSTNSYLPDSYWTRGLTECVLPYHSDGSRDSTSPEQFWNCAEVKILPSSSRSPTVSPKPTKSPTTAAPVSSRPSMPPGICIAEWKDCTSDQSSCCEGFKCTQVDPTGSSLCLADTCSWNPPLLRHQLQPPPRPKHRPLRRPTPTVAVTCHHEAGTFCALSKENCEGPCGKLWLENGELDGCTAMWEPCNTSDECCQHAICDNGSTPTKSPTIKSTKSPTTLLAPVTSAPQGQAFPAHESEFVRVNQMGYLMFAQKIGVVVDSSTSPLAWQIQDTSGFVVLNGVTTVYGHDDASDDHVHHADFSSLREIGSYRLVVNSIGASLTFKIAPSLYPELPHDAMNYFYFHRMGQEIPGKHLVDARYARPALHLGDSSLPPYPGWCNTCSNFDLRGSWADAGDFGIYTVNHAISAWTLLNLHELFPDAFVDGELNIDESGNSFPDVLDEVDYGSRFVRGMLPSDGGLASHKAHNHVWSAFPTTITDENNQQRSVMGSSTPATYAVARVNAHLARLWSSRGGDTVYSSMLWDAAIDAWSRADGTSKAYNANEASPGTGGGDYPDSMFDDDRYAAACEMYLTAFGLGDQSAETYKIAMMSSSYYKKIDQWDWATVYGAGTLSLYAAESDLSSTDKASIETNIVAFADKITQAVDNEGYPSNLGFPNEFSRYPWGSNSFIMNRAVVLAYAYEITGNVSYQNYLLRSMDYIMGVNAMGISYVTGYGEKSETDTHDRLAWAVGQDVFWPKGWLSGGPNNELINDSATPSGAAAKSYAGRGTAPQAWCSKENTINWNAPLAWVAWYIENKVVPNLGGCGEENCQPIANSLTGIKVNMDSWTSVLLTATDYDGVVASWEIVSLPQMGILSGSSPNLVYTPNSGFIGSDSFQFRVYDDSGNVSETALVEFIVQDCNFISKFEVPSDFPAFSGSYKYVHVSEDGPNLVEMRTPAHNVQWANPGLYQFSLEMNASPYYKDLSQCMTSQTLSDPTSAGFTLINCGISGLDGDYWVTQKDGNEIWVEKNNLWVIVFTNDVNYSPEFCRSSEGVSRVPTRNPTTLGPVSSNPTGLAHSTKPTLPTTSSPTMRPTSKGTAAPSSKSPSVAPNSSAGFGCYERNTGYQQRKADPWCNSQETNCGACAGLWLKNPLQRNGCCKWNPNDDCTAVDPNIQTKLASI
eukprot:CCRYP_009578-RB/>CCRYP_009578-RB protein AED:0.10 eAED:0.10 QI:327/0.69/0.64/1/0.76/0.71/14/317/1376